MTTTPTQVARPWRATLRTVFQALLAFAVILPLIVEASGLDPVSVPGLAVALAVAAAVTRIMALPQVEVFLARFLPFLAAEPAGDHRSDRGAVDVGTAVLIAIGVLLVLIALGVFGNVR